MLSALFSILLTVYTGPILTIPVVMAAPFATDAQVNWLHNLEQCESEGSTTVKILDTNGKFSYGVLQFQMATWLKYGKDFGATTTNIFDKDLQEHVALTMLDGGGWMNWFNCGNTVSSKYGSYPIASASP